MSRPVLCKSAKNSALPNSHKDSFRPSNRRSQRSRNQENARQKKNSPLNLRTERHVANSESFPSVGGGREGTAQWLTPPPEQLLPRRVLGMCRDNWTPTNTSVAQTQRKPGKGRCFSSNFTSAKCESEETGCLGFWNTNCRAQLFW